MQVSVETTSQLGRKMSISVPAEQIENKIHDKLQQLTKTIKMDGFRPGHVPYKIVQNRFGTAVREEVLSDIMQKSLFEAISQEKLNLAGAPTIESVKAESGQPLEYMASFEVFPEVTLNDFANIKASKFKVDISEMDLAEMLESIRKQHITWEETDRLSQKEDRLVIDFTGTMNNEVFEGGSAKDVPIILGSNTFIDGFEAGLVGLTVGANTTLNLLFPTQYHKQELAGKPVQFAVHVKQIFAPKLPELDEEFAKTMGVTEGGMDTLKTQVKEHMQTELERAIKNKMKQEIFEQLLAQNSFELPQVLVKQESEHIYHRMFPQHDHKTHGDHEISPEIESEAKKRISVGLLVAAIIKEHNIKADKILVRKFIEEMAKTYQHPEQVISWYYSKQENLADVEAAVLEEQAIEKILEKAQMEEKVKTYAEIMNPAQAHS